MVTDRAETLKCRTGAVRPFNMSSEARPRSRPALAVAIALVAIIAVGLGAGYYFASASSSFPVTWSVRPLMIKFNTSDGFFGSAPDSFTCSPSVSPVTLQAFSSQPDIITITVSPSSFPSCGSTPDNVTVTAACTAAHQDASCDGDKYLGTVEVCGPAPYSCMKQFLTVTVAVTTHK